MKPYIFTLNIDRGFCFYPFIILPSWADKDPFIKGSLLHHELIHFNQQSKDCLFFIKYLFKKYRWQYEREAYKAEIQFKRNNHMPISITYYVNTLVNDYWGMCDRVEAGKFIEEAWNEK